MVVPQGQYVVEVCSYQNQEPLVSGAYAGTFTTDDTLPGVNSPTNPKWKFFPANPPLNKSNTDTRIVGCWYTRVFTENGPQPVPGCDISLFNVQSRAPWDHNVEANQPSFTTTSNNATSAEAWLSPLTPAEQYRPTSPQREYFYPWTNQWYNAKCAQTVFTSAQRNDIDAATTNLFVQHNRMHDWAYRLGFRERTYNAQFNNFGNTPEGGALSENRGERDPETGNSQAGAVSGGAPSYLGRDNANQITLQDGIPPITNMYLWQPIAAAFYAPCVDGDYDMSVIGHEYTHLIVGRMVGGPDSGPTGLQGGAMNESWADQTAVEYLNEYSFVPTADENPFSVGAYVTGNKQRGIRNYGMNVGPLNYSNVGYDIVGPQVHADGEIWSATNFEIRQTLINKYNALDPELNAADKDLQRFCANGQEPYPYCPGNRRWMQIVFSAYLFMQPSVSMVDARDAYLAAENLLYRQYKRYYEDPHGLSPSNQAELWNVFAKRGLGENAFNAGPDDTEPVPSFESPLATNEAGIIFKPVTEAGTLIPNAKIYVGRYEARTTPVADTDPNTNTSDTVKFVPRSYEFLVQAPGYGMRRFTTTISGSRTFTMTMPTNWASAKNGATLTSNGTGRAAGTDRNPTFLIDDTESTSFGRVGRAPNVSNAEVIVKLPGANLVNKVQVSAYVRSFEDQRDPGSDTSPQSRFSALRKFQILTCDGRGKAATFCNNPANFQVVYTSPDNAFPGAAPHPAAPDLQLRTFDVADKTATHVKFRVLTNQCTGTPAYQGEQDNDPSNVTDCSAGSARENEVRAAELQVFSR